MRVRDIMTKQVVTIPADATLREALGLLRTNEFRHLPVVEGGKLLGVVSDRDVAGLALPVVVSTDTANEFRAMLDKPVTAIMRHLTVSVSEDDTLAHASALIRAHHIGAVVVTAQGQVTGLVSYVDLLRVAEPLFSA